MWPTSGREAVVVSVIKRNPDGTYLNVTTNCDSHPKYNSDASLVRMNARLAGVVVGAHPTGNPNRCRVVQLLDGDLNGNIPKFVIAMVTTQAFPVTFRTINKILTKDRPRKSQSDLIEEAESVDDVVVER